MSYKHLSQTERYQIYALMKAGHLPAKIAQLLGRHKSSISRELSRNTGNRGYRPQQADQRYRERAQSSRNARRVDETTRALVAERLKLQWSPEQIAASLPISHETIYQHVYADKAQGGWLFNARAASFEQNTVHRCARSPHQNQGVGVRWGRKIPLLIVWWGFALKADDVDARDGQGANDGEGRWDQVTSYRMQVWGNLWGKN